MAPRKALLGAAALLVASPTADTAPFARLATGQAPAGPAVAGGLGDGEETFHFGFVPRSASLEARGARGRGHLGRVHLFERLARA